MDRSPVGQLLLLLRFHSPLKNPQLDRTLSPRFRIELSLHLLHQRGIPLAIPRPDKLDMPLPPHLNLHPQLHRKPN